MEDEEDELKFDDNRLGSNSCQKPTLFGETKVKLGKEIATKIEEDVECRKIMKRENVKLRNGKITGPWNGIYAVRQWLMSYFPRFDLTQLGYDEEEVISSSSYFSIDQSEFSPSATDQSTQSKKPDDSLCVGSLFVRYVMAYHYEEYKKLENVCEEISFQFAELGSDRNVNLFARKDVKKETFDKVVNDFIDFYQSQNQKMQQEIFPVPGKNMKGVIAETQAKCSVVIDFSQKSDAGPDKESDKDSDKIIIYGEKEKVQEALKFLKGKKVDDSTGTTSSSSQPIGATGGSSSTVTRGSRSSATGSSSAAGSSSRREKSSTLEKFSCVLFQSVKVFVYQGDICNETSDVIVNPANEHLKHSAGTAAAVVKAGGKSIQAESDEIMKRRRHFDLAPGEVVATKAGNLPCKLIVHVVSPSWDTYSQSHKDTAKSVLFQAVLNSLTVASQNGATSVSMLSLSSGTFGVPVQICADVLFKAAIHFAKNASSANPLTDIRFVNIDEITTQAFAQEMKKRFGASVRRSFVVFPFNDKGSKKGDQYAQSQFDMWLQNPMDATNDSGRKLTGEGKKINVAHTYILGRSVVDMIHIKVLKLF